MHVINKKYFWLKKKKTKKSRDQKIFNQVVTFPLPALSPNHHQAFDPSR